MLAINLMDEQRFREVRMTKFYLTGAALAAALIAPAAQAATTVLDFDTLRNSSRSSVTYVQGPYSEDGFTLRAGACQRSLGVANAGCFLGVAPINSMDKVGASLATQFVSTPVTVTRDNGSAFLFQSIDFSEYFDNGIYQPFSTTVNFAFNFADGTKGTDSRVFSTEGKFLPTTFAFNLAAVSSVSWTPVTGSGVQFDNIRLADVAVASAVPEPASWAMMIGGFGVIGGTLRRRGGRRTLATA